MSPRKLVLVLGLALVVMFIAFMAVTSIYPFTMLNPLWIAIYEVQHRSVVREALHDVVPVREFDELYPGSKHFISYFTGQMGTPMWNSEATIHGRYILTFQMTIDLDRTRTSIVSQGPARYYLWEVAAVSSSGGRTFHGESQREFGEAQWRELHASGGDLATLGIHVVTDRPVPGVGGVAQGPPGGVGSTTIRTELRADDGR